VPPSAAKDEFIRTVLSEGLYLVTFDGQIISMVRKKPRLLKQSLMDDGYCRVGLSRDGEVHYVKAHRVVAIDKVPNPFNKPEVNHKDGVKSHNHPDNLEWLTELENSQHAIESGLKPVLKGEQHGNAKLTAAQVAEIRALRGVTTQAAIAARYKIHQGTVSQILSGRRWTP
jgi:hypothetical protein